MASFALPVRGAWGGSVYEEYKLVPCSSRPAGVVTRCSGPTPGARELESSSIVQPSPLPRAPQSTAAEAMRLMEERARGGKPRPPSPTSVTTRTFTAY